MFSFFSLLSFLILFSFHSESFATDLTCSMEPTAEADAICGGIEAAEDEEESVSSPPTISSGGALPQDEPPVNRASCYKQLGDTKECCADPSTCLGGEALSTFQSLSSVVSMVGPGVATAVQGISGKDMSGLCKALQGLAGTGGAVTMAAYMKCKSTISSCRNVCEQEKQRKCGLYQSYKTECEAALASIAGGIAIVPPLALKVESQAQKVVAVFKNQKECAAQKAQAKELMNNLAQMTNTMLSAELCKLQARANKKEKEEEKKREELARKKEECAQKGGKWFGGLDGECKIIASFNNQLPTNSGLVQSPGGLSGLVNEDPGELEGNSNQGDVSTDTTGGGGEQNTGILSEDGLGGDIGDLEPSRINDGFLYSSGSFGKSSGKKKPSRVGGRGFKTAGRRGYAGRKPAEVEKMKPGSFGAGGGGFSGYGGGGGFDDFNTGGGGNSSSLGLSKAEMEELEEKQGAKMAAPDDGFGGAHEDIFERISKRFQSLCKEKLDCR